MTITFQGMIQIKGSFRVTENRPLSGDEIKAIEESLSKKYSTLLSEESGIKQLKTLILNVTYNLDDDNKK